jgi:phage terminase large subunit-like protein
LRQCATGAHDHQCTADHGASRRKRRADRRRLRFPAGASAGARTADGPSGLDGSPYLPEPTVEAVPVHGVDFLAAKLREAEEPIVLVPTDR